MIITITIIITILLLVLLCNIYIIIIIIIIMFIITIIINYNPQCFLGSFFIPKRIINRYFSGCLNAEASDSIECWPQRFHVASAGD